MGARRLRQLPALIGGALLVASFAGCGRGEIGDVVSAEGLRGAAVVRLSAGFAVAARVRSDRVEVVAFIQSDGAWRAQQLASAAAGGRPVVQLVALSGETGSRWNAFAFGTAGARVSRVRLVGLAGVGGQVVDGAWVIALRQRDLSPRLLAWEFLSARGGVLDAGRGITP